MTRRRRVCVYTTGGTISMAVDPASGGAVPAVSGADLVAGVPGLEAVDVLVQEHCRVPSSQLTPQVLFDLARELDRALADPEVDGAVVVQGTDCIEESAYLFDLALSSDKPVVVTGAMKNNSDPTRDGPLNISDAVTVAAHPAAAGRGALVVFCGQVHAARDVIKTHTTGMDTFQSPGFGPVGEVCGGQVHLRRRSEQRLRIASAQIEPDVGLVKMAVGADERWVQPWLDMGMAGLVVEAFGSGNLPAPVVAPLVAAMDRGVPVVLVSRCIRGAVTPIYSHAGGSRLLWESGLIFAEYLSGPKARVQLMLALGKTRSPDEIRVLFSQAQRTEGGHW